jgi:hypothetical protein
VVTQAAGPQVGVECGQVGHRGHRRGPVALQVADAPLDVRLFLRPAYQAEQRLKDVMTGQCLVAIIEAALAADEQLRGDGARIVPPQFAGHTAEEGKGFDQAVQDRFGAFAGQRQSERAVGVGPGHQEHGHLPAAVGKIDIDVAEVRFEPLARIVVERDEGLALRPSLGENVVTNALVPAGVAVLLTQAAHNLGDGVPLLARRIGIGAENLVDHRFEGIDDRRQGAACVRFGFSLAKDLADLAPRVMEPFGQFADAHFVDAMGLSNACIFVHLDHPPPPAAGTRLR